MRVPQVNYRRLTLTNITSPTYRHLLLLLGWPVYFALYFLTENLIPPESCHVIHCAVDDHIPFCEWFLIPYVLWYGLVAVSLGWFALYHVKTFRNLQCYIIITQLIAMAVYILFPSRQELRPEVLPRENFLCAGVALLYRVDTPTGVCPSLHVAYSLGIASAWLRERSVKGSIKGFIVLFVITICLSTLFIKQHSALDVLAALPVCAAAEALTFMRKKHPEA